MIYVLSFLEGIITFISPCLLPMLPIYISYFTASKAGKRQTIINAVSFVLGFTIMFILMGAFAGTIGHFLQKNALILNTITGLIVIIFGLNFLGFINIGILNKVHQREVNVKSLNALSSILFGFIFSISWTPCIGAFLGSALMKAASSGETLQGIIMLFLFSMGLGIPFILSAILLDKLKGAFDFIKRHYKIINIISGSLLIIIGLLMMSGLLGRYLQLFS